MVMIALGQLNYKHISVATIPVIFTEADYNDQVNQPSWVTAAVSEAHTGLTTYARSTDLKKELKANIYFTAKDQIYVSVFFFFFNETTMVTETLFSQIEHITLSPFFLCRKLISGRYHKPGIKVT